MSNWVECPKCKVVDDQTNFCRNCGAAQKHSEIAQRSDNSAMVEICSKNICEYCMHGNTKPIRCIFLENCGGFNWFKHFIGRKLHQ